MTMLNGPAFNSIAIFQNMINPRLMSCFLFFTEANLLLASASKMCQEAN